MKKIFLAFIPFFFVLFVTGQTVSSLINQVSQTGIIQTVKDLSGVNPTLVGGNMVTIQHRVSYLGNNLSATYIKEHLISYGLTATEVNYSSGGRNVIAVKTGALNPGNIYIISAHYDAVADHGADDNASGVAAVLEAARIMSGYAFENTVVFALWDEEEIGLNGSANYANMAMQNGDNILGVLNMDMIAYDGDNDALYDIDVRNIANSYQIKTDLLAVTSTYGLALNGNVVDPGTLDSDHASFWNKGFSAVLLGEAWSANDICPGYHTSNDVISDFNITYFNNMTMLAVGYIVTKAVLIGGSSVIMTDAPSFHIFPNPTTDMINLNFETDFKGAVSLYNVLGIQLYSKQFQDKKTSIDLSGFDKGIYFLRLNSMGNTGAAIKVVLE